MNGEMNGGMNGGMQQPQNNDTFATIHNNFSNRPTMCSSATNHKTVFENLVPSIKSSQENHLSLNIEIEESSN